MVELVENNLHPITEELGRWQDIIGEHYIGHKLEEHVVMWSYRQRLRDAASTGAAGHPNRLRRL
jgi:hypothetical protein